MKWTSHIAIKHVGSAHLGLGVTAKQPCDLLLPTQFPARNQVGSLTTFRSLSFAVSTGFHGGAAKWVLSIYKLFSFVYTQKNHSLMRLRQSSVPLCLRSWLKGTRKEVYCNNSWQCGNNPDGDSVIFLHTFAWRPELPADYSFNVSKSFPVIVPANIFNIFDGTIIHWILNPM